MGELASFLVDKELM